MGRLFTARGHLASRADLVLPTKWHIWHISVFLGLESAEGGFLKFNVKDPLAIHCFAYEVRPIMISIL